MRHQVSQLQQYLQLLARAQDFKSRFLILGLIAQRMLISLRLVRAGKVFDRKHTVQFPRQIGISFTVLEELLPYLEIFVDHAYQKPAGFAPRADWTVLDCGANIGFFSLHCARQCRAVYAFEPNPMAFKHLQANIRSNRQASVGSIHSFNVALGSVDGIGYIRVDRQTTLSSSIMPDSTARRSAEDKAHVRVPVVTLDSLLPANNGVETVDLLKIDVEGSEIEVLKGAMNTLERTRRIVIEYHSQQLLLDVDNLLRSMGFQPKEERISYPGGAAGVAFYER